MKQSIEENAEGRENEREWPVTTMAKSSHGQAPKVFQEIKEEQDQKVVRKLSFCHQSLQRREKDISLSNVTTGFSFCHTTAKKSAVTSVSTQDIFSGTLRWSGARINLLFGGASPASSFLSRNQCNCQIVFQQGIERAIAHSQSCSL